MYRPSRAEQGFTLIELSIVLVIIGLIVGGVLAGQSLILSARLRKVVTEKESFTTASNTFRDKYGYLPGDLPTATNFWTPKTSVPANNVGITCAFAVGGSLTTACNGDGNGSIDGSTDGEESFFFFAHLSLAGMINGGYGNAKGGQDWTVPQSAAYPTADWNALNFGTLNIQWHWSGNAPFGNQLFLSKTAAGSCCHVGYSGVIPYNEAVLLDQKYDDGDLATGKILGEIPLLADECNGLGTLCSILFVTNLY